MNEDKNPIYSAETIAFFKAVRLFCTLLESHEGMNKKNFVKELRLAVSSLYVAALALPDYMEDYYEEDVETFVTEEMYSMVETLVKNKLAEDDDYLSAQCEEMKYSETPVLKRISEDVADIYQAVVDALGRMQTENIEIMQVAMVECVHSFKEYWGLSAVRMLEALHIVWQKIEDEENEDDEF